MIRSFMVSSFFFMIVMETMQKPFRPWVDSSESRRFFPCRATQQSPVYIIAYLEKTEGVK